MRKTITALLSKLYLPDQVETPRLQAMVVLIRNIASVCVYQRKNDCTCWHNTIFSQRRPLADAASRNALSRFEKSLTKHYPEQLEEAIDEDALRQIEALESVWGVIDGLWVTLSVPKLLVLSSCAIFAYTAATSKTTTMRPRRLERECYCRLALHDLQADSRPP
jgi:hypothetical protein